MIYIKKINYFKDNRGTLATIDHKKFKLFSIKRTFFINFEKSKITRGKHAHKRCSQFIICISGKIKIKTINAKLNKKNYILSDLNKGIYIKPLVWVEIASEVKNSSIVCFADRKYEKLDYINNFTNFKKMIK
jgi:UDP-2-acetamido-3-amino-2,3-dideoxy-glucuronate N-acetyltransferase